MSLNIALQYAVSGLSATQAQLQVISGNIANAQTPGYSLETLPQYSTAAGNGGAGVVTGEVQRATDKVLQAAILDQTSTSGASTTLNNFYQSVQNLLGQVGSGNTLGDALNNFTTAMQTVAATPTDPSAQANAVNSGEQLAQQLNATSSGIQTLRGTADSDIGTAVDTLNSTLSDIAQLNGQISNLQALGQPTATLEDQRDQDAAQAAQLLGIQTYTLPNGTMTVLTDQGTTLVDGTNAQQLDFTPAGTVTATTALSPITVDGTDITSDITTGQIGGLLQMRDTLLPGLTAQLNQFTNNLFNAAQSPDLQTANSGLGATNDANHFFADVDIAGGADNAATIQVNPDLVSNPSLLDSNAAGAPDPTITATISSNLLGSAAFAAAGGLAATTTTLSAYYAQVMGQNATAAAAATSNSNDQSALLTQMQSQYSAATGVNLDAELSTLITYQNAYSASARVISTIQDMYDALMNT